MIKPNVEIVIRSGFPRSEKLPRGKTYIVEHGGFRYNAMRAFRTKRKGKRVTVFQSTPATIMVKISKRPVTFVEARE